MDSDSPETFEASNASLEAGVQVGDFRIEERIGAGGMGIVYRARQVSLNRLVALKVLGHALSRAEDVLRFQREAQAAARLHHPGIASVYFIGQDHQLCYIAMELVRGVSLRRVLDGLKGSRDRETRMESLVSHGGADESCAPVVRFDAPTAKLPQSVESAPRLATTSMTDESKKLRASTSHVRRSCELVRDAAQALEHAHQNGVVHRDIKPENLLLDAEGRVHIIDFGIARFFDDVELTSTGQLVGTPLYMSPEQVTGRVEIDHRTDTYSLGLVLYELLTLTPAFQAANREALLRQIVTKSIVPVSWRNRAVPRALESVVHKATSKDPDDRYPTAKDFAEDLGRFLSARAVQAPPYRYRFDPREIVASRPGSVMVAAFPFFLLSVVLALGIVIPLTGVALQGPFPSRPHEWSLWIVPGGASVAAIGSFFIGRGLLGGRDLARILGAVVSVLVAVVAVYFFQAFAVDLSDLRDSMAEARGGMDEETFWRLRLGGLLPFLAGSALAAASGIAVVVVLFRRTTRTWFRFARHARSEHKRLREAA